MLDVAIYSELDGNDPQAEKLITDAARAAFALFEFPFDAAVDVTMTDDAGIREVNRQTREIDSATDVLSFPMLEFSHGSYQGSAKQDCDPETGRLFLGDILISLERARVQAQEYGHSTERECAYLTVHSMLHLLGYDHMDEGEEKAAMRQREEQALATMGLKREEQMQ